MSIVDLSAAEPDLVARISGKPVADAKVLVKQAAEALENPDIKNDIEMEGEIISASAVPQQNSLVKRDRANTAAGASGDKFSEAERRLREELAAFKLK
jgi:N utilization substance protein A